MKQKLIFDCVQVMSTSRKLTEKASWTKSPREPIWSMFNKRVDVL
jgi:hypothetical protein